MAPNRTSSGYRKTCVCRATHGSAQDQETSGTSCRTEGPLGASTVGALTIGAGPYIQRAWRDAVGDANPKPVLHTRPKIDLHPKPPPRATPTQVPEFDTVEIPSVPHRSRNKSPNKARVLVAKPRRSTPQLPVPARAPVTRAASLKDAIEGVMRLRALWVAGDYAQLTVSSQAPWTKTPEARTFVAEIQGLNLMARCALGDRNTPPSGDTSIETSVRRYLARWGGAPLARNVREACGRVGNQKTTPPKKNQKNGCRHPLKGYERNTQRWSETCHKFHPGHAGRDAGLERLRRRLDHGPGKPQCRCYDR